jgi:hypothetical protein
MEKKSKPHPRLPGRFHPGTDVNNQTGIFNMTGNYRPEDEKRVGRFFDFGFGIADCRFISRFENSMFVG